ncbi:MAG: HyaD/HybD family hydrogenase maturation endopeptidase [Nitrospinota bacterium]
MNPAPKIIVLGIGNILMSDEGAGVRVVEKLQKEYSFPPNVEIYDGGTTGMHGLMPLIEEADHLVAIDAVNGQGEPGTIYRYTLEDFKLTIPKKISAHDIGFVECLTIAELTGKIPQSVIIIGIKPKDFSTRKMELTDTVNNKLNELVDEAVKEITAFGASPLGR